MSKSNWFCLVPCPPFCSEKGSTITSIFLLIILTTSSSPRSISFLLSGLHLTATYHQLVSSSNPRFGIARRLRYLLLYWNPCWRLGPNPGGSNQCCICSSGETTLLFYFFVTIFNFHVIFPWKIIIIFKISKMPKIFGKSVFHF